MANKEQPNYYAIIPANVRYDENLAPNEKLLYGEITALCNKTGQCFATNQYFAELYKVEIETISRWIKHLNNNGYIQSYVDKEKGNQRYIQLSQDLLIKNSIPIDKKINSPIDKKVNNNNTNMNNTFNNTSNKKESKKEIAKTFDEIIAENFDNEKVKTELIEFIKMRKQIKKPMTNRALELLIKKLKEMSNNDCDLMVKLLDQSIEHGWQTIYELKDNKSYQKPVEQKPKYYNGFTMPAANETPEEMEFKRRVLSGRNKF